MAILKCNYISAVLNYPTEVYVILPIMADVLAQQGKSLEKIYNSEKKLKTLYLLHGANDDPSCYIRKTSVERYAEEKGIAVIIPTARNSFYTNMEHGQDYYTFISKEIPLFARSILPLSDKREDNYIAGLSMGGYGAMKIALKNPEQYCAVASMSGVLDIETEVHKLQSKNIKLSDVFEDLTKLKDSENDVLFLLKKAKENKIDIPKIYQACGTEDFLYEANCTFKKLAEVLFPDRFTYEESKGGHEWDFWDRHLKKIIDWL